MINCFQTDSGRVVMIFFINIQSSGEARRGGDGAVEPGH